MVYAVTWFMVGYFLVLHAVNLLLTMLAARHLLHSYRYRTIEELPTAHTLQQPPISVLVPAFNEEKTISSTVESLLLLSYGEYEVIVINDGSTDATLEALVSRFHLMPHPEANRVQIATKEVRGVYLSSAHARLKVIDKDNGGKADALNAGINASRYPLICGVDADSILDRDSLQKVVRPFLRDTETVATGGTIRAANGCSVESGHLSRVDLPQSRLALFQVVEYLRDFLFGRLGWSGLNAMLIISGAFGLFRKQSVIEVGGYRTGTIGEDMELVVRLHHHMRDAGRPYRIEFVPEPVCWTEVPEDLQTLKNQRVRWQRGLSESLLSHWGLLFSKRGGWPGWLAFPYMLLFEWLGPLIELSGYIWTLWFWATGRLSTEMFAGFLLIAIGLGVILSLGGVMLEQLSFRMYPTRSQLLRLMSYAVFENFGYRQLNAWWRLLGLARWVFEKEGQWGAMKRKGHWQGRPKA